MLVQNSYQGPLFSKSNCKMKLGDLLLEQHHNFSCSEDLASQDKLKSLYNEIFNIDRFLDW